MIIKGQKVLVDKEFKPLLKLYPWYINSAGYAYASVWSKLEKKTKKISMHRFIMGFPNCTVDHINGNSLDNRVANLRAVPMQENSYNSKVPSNSTTGFKGVSFRKDRGTFKAYIKFNQKQIYLGTFKTKEEASAAYYKFKKQRGFYDRTKGE
jgi:hypothetical protein